MTLVSTTVVGSYPQPDWLVDKSLLMHRAPPRVRARQIWRVPEPYLEQAQDDATILAIRDMERAGIDVITDGEVRRESYSNHFATALDGLDLDNPAKKIGRSGLENDVPRVVGPIRRRDPVGYRDAQFAKANSKNPLRFTVPGPFTMAQQLQDEYYNDEDALIQDLAIAVNGEIRDLASAGIDVVQIDEPYLQADPDRARRFGIRSLDRAIQGVEIPTAIHLCFGYSYIHPKERPEKYSFLAELADSSVDQISIEAAQPSLDLGVLKELSNKTIILGVISLADKEAEPARLVADRIHDALRYISAPRLIVAPDCGMKFIPRDVAFDKLKALVAGAAIVSQEISGG